MIFRLHVDENLHFGFIGEIDRNERITRFDQLETNEFTGERTLDLRFEKISDVLCQRRSIGFQRAKRSIEIRFVATRRRFLSQNERRVQIVAANSQTETSVGNERMAESTQRVRVEDRLKTFG